MKITTDADTGQTIVEAISDSDKKKLAAAKTVCKRIMAIDEREDVLAETADSCKSLAALMRRYSDAVQDEDGGDTDEE